MHRGCICVCVYEVGESTVYCVCTCLQRRVRCVHMCTPMGYIHKCTSLYTCSYRCLHAHFCMSRWPLEGTRGSVWVYTCVCMRACASLYTFLCVSGSICLCGSCVYAQGSTNLCVEMALHTQVCTGASGQRCELSPYSQERPHGPAHRGVRSCEGGLQDKAEAQQPPWLHGAISAEALHPA